jgi:hypothetical protein
MSSRIDMVFSIGCPARATLALRRGMARRDRAAMLAYDQRDQRYNQ